MISRSTGCCHSDSNCTHRTHKNHAEMQLLKKGKLNGNITIDSGSQNTQPCFHCLRSLLLYIQKNPKSKFTLIYKKNNEFIRIKSSQLHTLLKSSIVSSGMRTHKRFT